MNEPSPQELSLSLDQICNRKMVSSQDQEWMHESIYGTCISDEELPRHDGGSSGMAKTESHETFDKLPATSVAFVSSVVVVVVVVAAVCSCVCSLVVEEVAPARSSQH